MRRRGRIEAPQQHRMRQQPTHIEDAKERPRDAGHRLVDLVLPKLRNHQSQQGCRHGEHGLIRRPEIREQHHRCAEAKADGLERFGALVDDKAVELVLGK